MKANHVLAAVAVALCFTACSKNDGPETLIPAERKSVENLDVTNYGKWTYINLMGVNQHHAIDHVHVCKQRYACIIDGKQTQESHCPHAKICTDLLQHHRLAKIRKFIEMVKFSASFQA